MPELPPPYPVPSPDVRFDPVDATVLPYDDNIVIATYRPKPGTGWVLANCWHDRTGIITAILRRATTTDTQASDYYDL